VHASRLNSRLTSPSRSDVIPANLIDGVARSHRAPWVSAAVRCWGLTVSAVRRRSIDSTSCAFLHVASNRAYRLSRMLRASLSIRSAPRGTMSGTRRRLALCRLHIRGECGSGCLHRSIRCCDSRHSTRPPVPQRCVRRRKDNAASATNDAVAFQLPRSKAVANKSS
jgi:hypothetical protein